jgi:hypothetical protein
MNNNTTSSDREKIIDKLTKLIALSGSSNEHEANSALEKAMQIALENNIELSQLSFEEKKKETKVTQEQVGKGDARLPITHRYVADIIKKYFNVDVITSGSRDTGRKIWFFGKKDDIDFAKYLNTYLSNTMMNLWYAYYRQNPSKKAARESFIVGVWQGLNQKLKDNKEKMESVIAENVKSGYQLMMVDNKTAIKNAIDVFFPKVRYTEGKPISNVQRDALNAGYSQGQKINVHSGLNSGSPLNSMRLS